MPGTKLPDSVAPTDEAQMTHCLPSHRPSRRAPRGACRRRNGAVLVETALVLALLLGLCFGVMEYGHYVHTRHTLESASQRGARTAILRDSTEQEVNDAVEAVMAAAGYDTSEFSVDVTGVGDPDTTDVTVSVDCEWGEIGIRPLGLISADSVVRATVTMRKEGP